MAHMKATVRVEIELSDGSTSVVEHTVVPTGYGDNPIYFADVAEQASLAARTRVVDAIAAVHGTAPRPAHVSIPF